MEFDDVFAYIGEFGVYQIVLYMLLGITSFYPGYQAISMTFVAGVPEHWCKVDRLENFTYANQKNIAIPYADDDGNQSYASCDYFNLPYDNYTDAELAAWDRSDHNATTLSCDEWLYDTSVFRTTITAEWDLVCDKSSLVSLLSTLYLAGILVGAPMSGVAGDRFGRFPTLMGSCVLHFIFAFAGAFANSYISFIILRFLMSIFNAAAYLTGFVIVMEVIGPRFRTGAGIVFQMFFSLGFMTLPAIAYFVRDYQNILFIMALPVLSSFGFYWLVPESPRWLLANDKEEEALKIVRKIAAINKRVLPDDIKITPSEKVVEKGSFGDILRHPLLRKNLFIMYLAWFTNSLVYYGLSLNTGALLGSVYLNTFLSGFVEIPANLLCIWLMYVVGRRLTLSWGFIVGGVACLLCIPFLGNSSLGWLVTTFSMLGKAAITLTFSVVYVYAAELFPTPVRHLAVGSSSMMARVSGLISPFMGEPLMKVWPPLPSLIFGLFAVMSGIFSFWLPETLGTKLPDTIEDAEEIAQAKSKRKDHKDKKNIEEKNVEKGAANKGYNDDDDEVANTQL